MRADIRTHESERQDNGRIRIRRRGDAVKQLGGQELAEIRGTVSDVSETEKAQRPR
jgi:hypothetical protein